jgi:hypothetical protein
MVVLRGAQAVGLGPHLSHLIYIYKSKITKYMYMGLNTVPRGTPDVTSDLEECFPSSRLTKRGSAGAHEFRGPTSQTKHTNSNDVQDSPDVITL